MAHQASEVQQVIQNVGIVRPEVFWSLGKRLTFFFLRTSNWPMTRELLLQSRVTSFAVFGQHDAICKFYVGSPEHFSTETRLASLKSYTQATGYFVADKIDVYQGFQMEWQRSIAENKNITDSELDDLALLQRNWKALPEDKKEPYINKGLVFDSARALGDLEGRRHVKAFVTVNILDSARQSIFRHILIKEILPIYQEDIIGIYWAVSRTISATGIVEIVTQSVNRLISFINELYSRMTPIEVSLFTDTYIVGEVLFEGPPPLKREVRPALEIDNEMEAMREFIERGHTTLIKLLPGTETGKLGALPLDQRLDAINTHQRYEEIVRRCKKLFEEHEQETLWKAQTHYVSGVLFDQLTQLGQAVLMTSGALEKYFTTLLMQKARVKFKDENELQSELALPHRKVDRLTASAVAEALLMWNKKFPQEIFVPTEIVQVWMQVIPFRNLAVHQKYETLTPVQLKKAMADICFVMEQLGSTST